jgi:UDP-4-keto-6-deoxy-N-acetylglucosamine 4-aminotransferase
MKQTRANFLSYGRQMIDDDDVDAVVRVLKSDFLTTGPNVEAFERRVADFVGVKYAVAVSNGTAGLHMACSAAGISEGDEVIVSPMTFVASANCILYCGAKPVFVDISEKNYNISIAEIERSITEKTKAIIPIDYTGQPIDIDNIRKIADKHHLTVIEDAAHALGSEYKDEKVGKKADMTVFSFHPVKPITTGEGGMVVTDNEVFYKRMLRFRSHGISRERELFAADEGPWYYEQLELGYNYRITDIQCALGISQMNKIDRFIKRRREIAAIYNSALANIEEITIPYQEIYSNSGWHLYIVKFDLKALKCTRNEIYKKMHEENIGVNVHYLPVYKHPYYHKLGYDLNLCRNAEDLYQCMLTLPLFPAMNDQDVMDVINAIEKTLIYLKNRA